MARKPNIQSRIHRLIEAEDRVAQTGRKRKLNALDSSREALLPIFKLLNAVSQERHISYNAISKLTGIPQAKISQLVNCKHEPNRQSTKTLCNLIYLVLGIELTRDDFYNLIDRWEADTPYVWEAETLVDEEGTPISVEGLMQVKLLIGCGILQKYQSYEAFLKQERLDEDFTVERLEELCSISNHTIPSSRELSRLCAKEFLTDDDEGEALTPADLLEMMIPENQNSAPEKTKAELSNILGN